MTVPTSHIEFISPLASPVYHFSPAHTLPRCFLDGYSYREGKSDTPGFSTLVHLPGDLHRLNLSRIPTVMIVSGW
jgi:hypothetical protein